MRRIPAHRPPAERNWPVQIDPHDYRWLDACRRHAARIREWQLAAEIAIGTATIALVILPAIAGAIQP